MEKVDRIEGSLWGKTGNETYDDEIFDSKVFAPLLLSLLPLTFHTQKHTL